MGCEFCQDSLEKSIKNRTVATVDNFLIAVPRKPVHEFHLLVFDKSVHASRIHLIEDQRALELKKLIGKLDSVFTKYLEGYQGYNMTSNNGSIDIGQHVQHAHLHLFMRFKQESKSPFARMGSGENLSVKEVMIGCLNIIKHLDNTEA